MRDPAIRFNHLGWLTIGLVLVVIPHVPRLPVFIPITFCALAAWRLLGSAGRLPLPDREHRSLMFLKQVLAVVVFVSVYQALGSGLGRDSGVALLVVLLGLKLLELQTPRDYYVVTFLSYFLVITNFFYSQSIPTAGAMLVVVLFITVGLVGFNDRHASLTLPARSRIAARLLLHALPLMLVLFILFPRVSGPLWGLPADSYGATSGLSDEMTPGSISALSLSEHVAFRAAFDGRIPAVANLYWRGPVLWHTDGRTWSAGGYGSGVLVPVYPRGEAYSYTITLEPHNKRWLFALEMPTQTPIISRTTRDLRLLARRPIRQRIRYQVTSHIDYRITDTSPTELESALQLPKGFHPRAVALAQRWRDESSNPRVLVNRALSYFREREFFYTLTPPLPGNDPVDGFLFDTLTGFCEHYASAFVTLMRAAGVPARVVTGYQGGEFNPLGDYLIVRQRDAHAWAEVWFGGSGWVRVDPAAAVAPARVELGIDDVLSSVGGVFGLNLERNSSLLKIWRGMRNTVDAVNNGWNQWILGYGPQRQRQLVSLMGLRNPQWKQLALLLITSVSIILGALLLRLLAATPPPADRVRGLYDRFCAKMAKRGLRRQPHEGPLDFAQRARLHSRQMATSIDEITRLYVRLRYSRNPGELKDFADAIRHFRP